MLQSLNETQEANAKIHGILRSAPDGILVTDAKNNLVLINRRAEELIGFCLVEQDEIMQVEGIPHDGLVGLLCEAVNKKQETYSEDLSFQLHYFSIRKMHFLKRARALCAFPGGFGTMDELFETLTLIQTRKIERIPIVLFGREFWEDVINWDAFVRRGVISPADVDLFIMSDDPVEGWNHIREFYGEPTAEM